MGQATELPADSDRSGERFAAVGDLALCYQTFGDPADDADARATTEHSLAREAGNGSGRQLAAVVAERDRTADLRPPRTGRAHALTPGHA